jgi:hypothetical protein
MRIRTLKPDFWKHQIMAQQRAEVRLLAIGLLNLADDEGYFMAHPALIRGELMPFLDKAGPILQMLNELEAIGYLTLARLDDGRDIGHINNFRKHQVINKPARSKIKVLLPESSDSTTTTLPEHSRSAPVVLQDDYRGEWNREGNREKEGKGVEGNGSAADAASAPSPKDFQTGSRPEKKEGGAGVPVSVEEALAYAESYSKGNGEMLIIEDASVRNWFDDRSTCNWEPVRSGVQVPITDWRADLRKWAREDKRRGSYATPSTAKKEKALPVEEEPAGWWDAWALCWPEVECPKGWHGIPESYKTELRIKLEDMTR